MMTRTSGIASAVTLAMLVVLLAVMAAGSRRVMAENHWPIQWIEVQGEFERVSAEQVRSAAVPMLSSGFFGVELSQVQSRVEELPWVRAAEVRKVWPDQLVVRVEEHQPMARWHEDRLVSDLGDVFSVEGVIAIEGLPELTGPEGTAPQMIKFFHALRQRLTTTGLDVLALKLSARGGWEARLSGDMKWVIGREQPLRRVDRLISAMNELRADPSRRPVSVDLRYTNGFAVRWAINEQRGEVLAVANGAPENP